MGDAARHLLSDAITELMNFQRGAGRVVTEDERARILADEGRLIKEGWDVLRMLGWAFIVTAALVSIVLACVAVKDVACTTGV